jgi:ATP-binding cassette, subfamily B, multidrug efflux pump
VWIVFSRSYLLKTEKKNTKLDFKLIWRLFQLAKPYKRLLILTFIYTVILIILAPIRPYLVKIAIDDYMSIDKYDDFLLICFIFFVHLLLHSIFIYLDTYSKAQLGQNVIEDLRKKTYRHLLHLKKATLDQTKVGTLVTRAVSDIETISDFFSSGIISVISELIQLLTILGVMFYMSWELTLVSMIVLPILLLVSEYFRRGVKSSFQKVRTQVSLLNTFVQEHITGIQVVQNFNQEEREFQKFRQINKGHLDAFKKSIFHYSVYFPAVEILNSIAIGLIIWWAANSSGVAFPPGLIISFVLFVGLIFRPLRLIADRFNTMQMGMVASDRVFELLDKIEDIENSGSITNKINGDIIFNNVTFGYDPNDPVLKNVSFLVPKGSSLAIVGATGSGKSTIANLLSANYKVQKGEISIDGIPIESYDLISLRNQIAVVMQDVFLFAGSIFDNVTLFDENISLEKVQKTAKNMGLEEFILQLDQGWEYQVMERGSALSVGQRQLISFLRAMVVDPSILILDEATSSVDQENEALIQETVKTAMKKTTSVVIAHRLSTIQEADQILVLDKGMVVEMGTHQNLLNKKGYYHELYHRSK